MDRVKDVVWRKIVEIIGRKNPPNHLIRTSCRSYQFLIAKEMTKSTIYDSLYGFLTSIKRFSRRFS